MAYSQARLIHRIRQAAGEDSWHDICTEAMDTTETGLDVADTAKWSIGDVVEFQDDGEMCLVTALPSGTTLTVIRNYLLSVTDTAGTGTAHSINADIVKTPVFRFSQVTEAIQRAIEELYPRVYKVLAVQLITPLAGQLAYEISAVSEDLIRVQQLSTSAAPNLFMQQYGGYRNWFPAVIERGLPNDYPAAGATSGRAIRFEQLYNLTNQIRVEAAARITDTVSGGNYQDFSDGFEVSTVLYYSVAELADGAGLHRLTANDVGMGDQSVSPGQRERYGGSVWRSKGRAARQKWEEFLRDTAPRMR
jgi:hypothetical protein